MSEAKNGNWSEIRGKSAANQLQWYPRFPQAFIGSMDCRTMTLEQYGLFNWLLDYSWNNTNKPCFLENSAEKLSKLIGITQKKFVFVFSGIRHKFQLQYDDNGKEFIFNPRLLREYQKQQTRADVQSERGQKGATVRWSKQQPSNSASNASSNGAGIIQASSKQCITDNPLENIYKPPIVPLTAENASSMLQVPATASGNGSEPRLKSEKTTDAIKYPPEFEAFWKLYPKRVGKLAAFKAWRKINPSAQMQEIILAAVVKARQSTEWTKNNGEFVPHPATWLNQGRWDDELSIATVNRSQSIHEFL